MHATKQHLVYKKHRHLVFVKTPPKETSYTVRKEQEKIARFGFSPVVVDSYGRILSGEERVVAARLMKLDPIPVLVAPFLSNGKEA